MNKYSQPTKIKARKIVIKEAIERLTVGRKCSTLVRRSYVREVREHIARSDLQSDVNEARLLADETISRWESFYDSVTQSKESSNLKVAYLSGPNPENDLKVFCGAGILPENIWAFESEKETYSEAIKSALDSKFPFIKIINGGIDSFIEISRQRFDIIYLDFCGPLPSRTKKQKTLRTITKILGCHSLNSPGILITNVSLPTQEQDADGRELISKLVSSYLYPKEFLESNGSEENYIEGPICEGIEFDEWTKKVITNLDDYYGQFVTRLIMDHANFISLYDRFHEKNGLFNKFFKISDKYNKINSEYFHFYNALGGEVIAEPGNHPILWTLGVLDESIRNSDPNYPEIIGNDSKFEKFAESFISQLGLDKSSKKLIKNLSTMSFLVSQGGEQESFFSESIKKIYKNHSFNDYYQFCDLFLFHQIIELLIRQVAGPYHVNVEKTKRWNYLAKETPMFMDMIVLDECRYLYDWMPTSDMISTCINDMQRQLSYRFALDGVAKHSRWYNLEYFSGAAVIDQLSDGFEAKILSRRELIVS